MALPTPTDEKTLNISADGTPFVEIPAKDSIVLSGMDISFNGTPFVRNPSGGATSTGKIKAYVSGAFTAKPVKVYNGATWVTKPLKVYNGSSWVVTNY